MPKLGEVAHYTGKDRPKDDASSEGRSQLVWLAMRQQAKHDPNLGLITHTSMKSAVQEVFPELDSTTRDLVYTLVNEYLKATGNARNIQRGAPGEVTWVLSTEWRTEIKAGQQRSRWAEAERRLTAKEAGEDREPSAVTVRKMEKAKAEAERKEKTGQYTSWPHEPAVLDLVAKAEFPLTERELVSKLGLLRVERTNLRKLVESKAPFFARFETREERQARVGYSGARPARLYWHETKIPYRTQPDITGYRVDVESLNLKSGTAKRARVEHAVDKLLAELGESKSVRLVDMQEEFGTQATRIAVRQVVDSGMGQRTDGMVIPMGTEKSEPEQEQAKPVFRNPAGTRRPPVAYQSELDAFESAKADLAKLDLLREQAVDRVAATGAALRQALGMT